MKKTNIWLFIAAAFAAGFISALLWTSYKGPPPMVTAANQPMTAEGVNGGRAVSAEFKARFDMIEQQVKSDPGNFSLLAEAGNLAFDLEMFKEAASYYERALAVQPDEPDVLTDLATAYRNLGDAQKAVELLRRVRSSSPDHQNSALNLGVILFHDLNDKAGALAAWEEYLALNPEGERAENIRRTVNQLRRNR